MTFATQAILFDYVPSPLGQLLLTSDGERLTGLHFPDDSGLHAPGPAWSRDPSPFNTARRQLAAYFAGRQHAFDIPLSMAGSPFELRVWKALCDIPYGTTVSYREIAERIGQPTACRAVGLANGRNPIPIIVPCHRVIGADGSLTGYGGGLSIKQWLLEREGIDTASLRTR